MREVLSSQTSCENLAASHQTLRWSSCSALRTRKPVLVHHPMHSGQNILDLVFVKKEKKIKYLLMVSG